MWHNQGVDGSGQSGERPERSQRRVPPPLSPTGFEEMALRYVGRFATSRAKLATYLRRKLKERGWAGDAPADVEGLVERLAGLGYVDDSAFALSKARALGSRGYGRRRVAQALHAAGIEDGDGAAAQELARKDAADSALRFARRRRIGPFATQRPDTAAREKALGAMVRAGHDFAISRFLVDCDPGREPDSEELLSFRS